MLTMKPIDGQSSSDGPFQRPRRRRPLSTMDQFDRLVLKAAKSKRKEIIDRYGDEGCSKLLARKTKQDQQLLVEQQPLQKDDNDESVTSDYEKTIQDLKEAQKELNSSCHSHLSNSCHSHLSKENQSPNHQKKERRRRPVHAKQPNNNSNNDDNDDDNDDDDLDIDKLFELAWGSDISPPCSTLTSSSSTLTTAASTPYTSPTYTKPTYTPPPATTTKLRSVPTLQKPCTPPTPPATTTKTRYSPKLKIKKTTPIHNHNNSDEVFAKKLREGTVRKLLKARETKTPEVRRVPSKDKHPGSLAWQWNLEGYVPKSEKPIQEQVVTRSGWQWNLA